MTEQAEAIWFINVHLAFLFNALFPPRRQLMIYQITPVHFYLNGCSLESDLLCMCLVLRSRHPVQTTPSSILYLSLFLLGVAFSLDNTDSYFYYTWAIPWPNTTSHFRHPLTLE